MDQQYLTYRLEDGHIHHWLAAGPLTVPLREGVPAGGPALEPCALGAPADQARLSEELGATWAYRRCLEDHLVHLNASGVPQAGRPGAAHAWAYTELVSPAAQPATLRLTAMGAAELWLRGGRVGRLEAGRGAESLAVEVTLDEGRNPLLVALQAGARGDVHLAAALRVEGLPPERQEALSVRLATMAQRPDRQKTFEHVFDHAYVSQVVATRGDTINLRWSEDLDTRWKLAYHIQDQAGRIHLDGTAEARASTGVNAGHPARLWERPYTVTLRALPREYWEERMRYERRLPVHVLDTGYEEVSYGTYEGRRQEALEDAARREGDLYGQLARCALGRPADLDAATVQAAADAAAAGLPGSAMGLLGLLVMGARYGQDPAWPAALPDAIQTAALAARLEPTDGEAQTSPRYVDDRSLSEAEAILIYACEVLAGRAYPEETFADGQTGAWHLARGQRLANAWIRQRGQQGFCEWLSPEGHACTMAALAALGDLASEDPSADPGTGSAGEELSERATIVLDKMLFSLALHSFRGSFGAARARSRTESARSHQLAPTAPICRLLWGQGVWNHHTAGVVSLACSEYELPQIITAIAYDTPEVVEGRERQACPDGSQETEANIVTYKTPDYMLSSVQDHNPGAPGRAEHVWMATLGPDAVAYTNHPTTVSDDEALAPNAWRGNGRLPRVAQHKDLLVAVYRLPGDDPLGFTHAYLPVHAFDEYATRGGWIMVRRGHGYLALTAAGGIALVTRGPGAYREVRSPGRANIWICQLGRAATDEDWRTFVQRVGASRPDWADSGVRLTTLRGQIVSFGWEEPLTVDGQTQRIGGYRHIDNPYCAVDLPATQMEVRWQDYALRLDLS